MGMIGAGRDHCPHALSDINLGSEMPNHVIEEIVKSRSAFKKVIEECVAKVVADEKTFPNWTRVDVSNARKWSPLVDVKKIAAQLLKAGAEEIYTLLTPAQVKNQNEGIEKIVDKLTLEQGHHVRLYPGAPKGAPKDEPITRPKAKKKSARKKAARRKTK